MNEWELRDATEEDLNFIYASWSYSMRYGSDLGRDCRNHIFFKNYLKVIDYILTQARTVIAWHPSEPSVILGYITFEPDILHYCFVKDHYRKQGIGKSLYNKTGPFKYYTNRTNMIKRIQIKNSDLTYNPFILYKQLGDTHGRETANSTN